MQAWEISRGGKLFVKKSPPCSFLKSFNGYIHPFKTAPHDKYKAIFMRNDAFVARRCVFNDNVKKFDDYFCAVSIHNYCIL
jgi:hypothetical protein